MISKNELKYYSSLLNKKFRVQEKKFLIEGEKLIREGIDSNFNCEVIISTNEFAIENPVFIDELNDKNIQLKTIKNYELKKLTDTKNPQGIIGVFSQVKLSSFLLKDINDELIVCLENISDPGNLGTILRIADWFGIENVLITKNSVEVFNPKVIRASMGSIFHLNIFDDLILDRDLKLFKEKGYKILTADLSGKNIFNYTSQEKSLIFFCNESFGPSNQLKQLTDETITIPKLGKAESLNVAAASSVILSQLKRSKLS